MSPSLKANSVSATAPRVLIVDDDPGQRSLLNTFLHSQGFQTLTATSGEEALKALNGGEFGMMISDVRMPGLTGLETLRLARQTHPTLPVLLVTAYADIREAVGAMRDGAVNYLAKPIDLDELLTTVQQATGLRQGGPIKLAEDCRLPDYVVARSPLMQTLFNDAAQVAVSDCPILVTGESGTGKEVLADVIHAWSPRAKGPLVKVNCAAIPDTLLESELFGHEKGAFTGAIQQRTGRFEEANGGTIFLDEISEMSPQLQAKLLRITQNGSFRRVGSGKEMQTTARILAATNRNLEAQIKSGQFREDLFYRLNVVELSIPPLRERREDVLPLAAHFIAQFSKDKARFSSAVNEYLESYSWPGNVRELRNAMERAALLSRGEIILPEHLPSRVREAVVKPATGAPDPQRLEEIENEAILQALKKHDYNRTETAQALGISRRALTYKLQYLREQGQKVDPD